MYIPKLQACPKEIAATAGLGVNQSGRNVMQVTIFNLTRGTKFAQR